MGPHHLWEGASLACAQISEIHVPGHAEPLGHLDPPRGMKFRAAHSSRPGVWDRVALDGTAAQLQDGVSPRELEPECLKT